MWLVSSHGVSCRSSIGCKQRVHTAQSSSEDIANTMQDSKSYNEVDLTYNSALQVLTAYHTIHGDLVIPRKFVVPATDGKKIVFARCIHCRHIESLIVRSLNFSYTEYPREWHGTKPARRIYNMRWWALHVAQNSDRVAQLNKLDFIWGRLQSEWSLFMESLVYYYSIYGDVLVPVSFIVPREDDWPKACWDFPLGDFAHRIRFRNDFVTGKNAHERRSQLDGLGYVWDVNEYKYMKFFRALKIFDKLEKKRTVQSTTSREFSTIRVPSKFVVPSGHENGWPEDLWDYQLGAKTMAVRQKQLYVKNHPDRKRQLEEIGFRWSGNATLGWLDVVHAAAIYSQMHGRVLNVPFDFVVPEPPRAQESWPWPEQLWGLRLGQRLKDVRLKGSYIKGKDGPTRVAQLEALGFVWSPKRGRRQR